MDSLLKLDHVTEAIVAALFNPTQLYVSDSDADFFCRIYYLKTDKFRTKPFLRLSNDRMYQFSLEVLNEDACLDDTIMVYKGKYGLCKDQRGRRYTYKGITGDNCYGFVPRA